jgi:hypothetical protein
MIKSRRKLISMKVIGKVYDPMPRSPTTPCAVNACSRTRAFDARSVNTINIDTQTRKVRVLKSGVRRVTYK